MVNAQEWLDQKYPKEIEETITKLAIGYQNLTGSLVISDWESLQEIYCYNNKLTNLTITNCPHLTIIDTRSNQLTNLTLDKLPKLKEIWFAYSNLSSFDGSNNLTLERLHCSSNYQLSNLNCQNNLNLTEIECYDCNLTNLDVSVCENLAKLDCRNNQLTILLLPTKAEKLITLNLNNNQLTNLSIFLFLKKLRTLDLEGNPLTKELVSYPGNYIEKLQSWKRENGLKEQLAIEQAKIPTLETEILRLTNLIKVHKEKIIKAYTAFFAEKELLKELITVHLDYTKAKGQNLPSVKLNKQKQRLYNELEAKIGEEQMEQAETILTNCEELIHYENELQTQISQNQKLITNHQQVINQITYNISNLNLNQGHALIGNTLGNETNLHYQIEEVLEAKVEVPKMQAHTLQSPKPN